MTQPGLLSPQEAEAVVDDRIEQFGLGALPRVEVSALPDGSWRIRWEDRERIVPPMTPAEWHRWLEEFVGPLDAGDLETTES